MVNILSWNTLESGEGGAWSNGWGCPLEIARREELIKTIIVDGNYDGAKSKAEKLLTQERYRRIRRTLLEEILQNSSSSGNTDPIDFLLFQECTVGDFWDEPPVDPSNEDSFNNEFFRIFDSMYQKVPCQAKDDVVTEETVQHVYVRRNSGWETSSSIALQSEAFVGGCFTEFTFCQNAFETCLHERDSPSLILVNLHGKARNMRDPDLRRKSISNLWEEIGSHFADSSNGGDDSSWKSKIVLCGDWNTQLSDLIEPFRHVVNSDNTQLEPIVGMLNNATATTDYPFFSTNHEDSFLAQYDGCLFFGTPSASLGTSPSYLELEDTSWNLTGFMPKGEDGKLSGDHPGSVVPMYNNFTYYQGSSEHNYSNEGVYLNGTFLPGSKPSMGLSDHLRIYTKINVNGDRKANKNDGSFVEKQQLLSPVQQRRPYRQYGEDNFPTIDEDDSGNDKSGNGSGSRHLRG